MTISFFPFAIISLVCASVAVSGSPFITLHLKHALRTNQHALSTTNSIRSGDSNVNHNDDVPQTNSALVFIKPHANNDAVQDLVRDFILSSKIRIVSEGDVDGRTMDQEQLIDRHYYAIAWRAVMSKPQQWSLSEEQTMTFQSKFKQSWSQVLAEDRVCNAEQACERLGVDADGLGLLWDECERQGRVVKLGGGFYCGQLNKSLYVSNGFYLRLRHKFVDPPSNAVHWYNVEWDSSVLSWSDFRGQWLGCTDPARAPRGSLRRTLRDRGLELGLTMTKSDNGVHASASPLEAYAEKINWLGSKEDLLSEALKRAGIPSDTIRDWSKDPSVTISGVKKSLFDAVEDTNVDECFHILMDIHKKVSVPRTS